MGNGYRYWSWTLFYEGDLEAKERTIQDFAKTQTLYTVYGKEICPKTKKSHLQGYFVFKNQHEMKWIKRRTFQSMHLEPSRRSAIANTIYCEKDGDVWKFQADGFDPLKYNKKEKTEKYTIAVESARKGNFDEIDPEIYVKYADKLKKIWMEEVKVKTLFIKGNFHNHFLWLHGPSGVGKSFRARIIFNKIKLFFNDYLKFNPLDPIVTNLNIDLYDKLKNKWWDFYKYQTFILCEEMDPENAKFMVQNIKIWCDQYPFPVEVKQGSFKSIRPMFFIFTSNYSMDDCFTNPKDLEALKRRIKEIHLTDRQQKTRWPNLNELYKELRTQNFYERDFESQYQREYLEDFKEIDWSFQPVDAGERPTIFDNLDKNNKPQNSKTASSKEIETITIPDTDDKENKPPSDNKNTPSDAVLPSIDSLMNNGCNSLGSVIDECILENKNSQSSYPFSDDDEFFKDLESLVQNNQKAVDKFNAFTKLKEAQEKDLEARMPKIYKFEPHYKRKGKEPSASEEKFKKHKKNFL